MAFVPRPFPPGGRFPGGRPAFIPRAPRGGGRGAALPPSSGGLAGLIGGIAGPLLCIGCLASTALLGLFATMIAAAVFMNRIQAAVRSMAQGAGSTIELNMLVLFCALFCSIYVLTKHPRGAAIGC